MLTPARTVLTLVVSILLVASAMAQTLPPDGQAVAPIVTATASTARVRYVSVGEVHQTRLQVFSVDGAQVFDSGFRLGNLINWPLQDQQGLRLSAGTYIYLVTVKDFSDRSTQKYGSAVLDHEQVYLEQTSIESLPQAQASALEANRNAETLSAVDRVGVVALDSSMTGSTGGGSPTGTQPSGTESSQPATAGENISGTGTQNFLARWTDNAGTLGDSILFQSASGRIGLGTTTPGAKLHVVGTQGSIGGGTFQLDTSIVFNNFTNAFPAFEIINTNPTNNNVSFFQFADAPSGAAHAGIGAVNTSHTSDFGNLFFFTKQADGYQARMGIYGGNVGIGTTAPGAKLWLENIGGGSTLVANNSTSIGLGGFFQNLHPNNADHALQGITYGTGRAGSFRIANANNTNPALRSETNASGGVAGEFVNTDTLIGPNIAVRGLTSGGTASDTDPLNVYLSGAGEFVGANGIIGAVSSTSPVGYGVLGLVGASGTANSIGVHGHNLGSGRAGNFTINNTASPANALEGETNGTGFAARFRGLGASSKGVQITSATGEKGLEITKGRVILSYEEVSGGGTISSDVAVVNVMDDGAATQPSVALPSAAEDGTVIVVGTVDAEGAEITGATGGPHTVGADTSRRFTRIGGAWKSEL